MISCADTELSSLPPFRDLCNSTSWVYGTCISALTYPGDYSTQSGGNIQECHRQDDIWNQIPTCALIGFRKCQSLLQVFEHQYWQAGKPIQSPSRFLWYITILRQAIMQRPTLIDTMESCDFWYISTVKHKICVGWLIAMTTRIRFKLQVPAMTGFHSLIYLCR